MAVSSADKKKLGKWIKQSREKKQPHLSQRQLALAVDITNASLSSIESGMIFPSEELLLKLIEQLQPPPELREKMLTLFAKAIPRFSWMTVTAVWTSIIVPGFNRCSQRSKQVVWVRLSPKTCRDLDETLR